MCFAQSGTCAFLDRSPKIHALGAAAPARRRCETKRAGKAPALLYASVVALERAAKLLNQRHNRFPHFWIFNPQKCADEPLTIPRVGSWMTYCDFFPVPVLHDSFIKYWA